MKGESYAEVGVHHVIFHATEQYCQSPSIWTVKNDEGKTDYDKIKEYGLQGWELVSATPVSYSSGETNEILFTFKRQIE